MSPVKLNTVLIGGFNDDEIASLAELTLHYPVQLRFIELMPIGDTKGEFGGKRISSGQRGARKAAAAARSAERKAHGRKAV